MLDQDARPEVAPLSESNGGSRPTRSRKGAGFAAAVVTLAVAVAAGFAIGRNSADTSSRAITTRAPGSQKTGSAARTPATVPTRNIDELTEAQPDKPLDRATRAAVAADLTVARTVAAKYPTVASALAAGFKQAGKFAPGAGAHYIAYGNVSNEIRADGSVDPLRPGAYIYDGISPTSRVVGLMYLSLSDGPAPAGFPGPNDHWHRHANLCIKYGATIEVPFAPDRDVTKAQCDAVKGDFMQKTVWMVHAWVVPGWESPKGVYSHSNPDLACADGTFKTDSIGFCKGT